MKDNRVRVETLKKIDLAVLDQELGGHGLCGSETEIVAIEGSPITKTQLESAIELHVYVDVEAERLAARVALRASAEAKLAKLGLSIEEITAVLTP